MSTHAARPYILLSIGAAVLTMILKFGAYRLTGSVGLLSDAMESGVNLLAALVAFWALSLAGKPPDAEHPFGHSKAEYFSSGLESALIVVAAIGIIWTAANRLLHPQPIMELEGGLVLAIAATVINGGVAWILLKAGRRFNSITLRADAHHLLTDVWTSLGVVVAVLLIAFTGWTSLDPLIAIAVALNILWTGGKLMQETLSGLLDKAIPKEQIQEINTLLEDYQNQGLYFHSLKTRMAGTTSFISFHVLVPGHWTVHQGHDLCETIENAIIEIIPGSQITTHLEPLEDPRSWEHPMDYR
ncbi:cation diffusion facilitator family transporter [Synechocystis sp. LKSZ1]|uniref:cation diffusion facilitator family transporter n=1 Tax=Synechocystis sp. LKSZ1 TaxID=3144951 RepID=UPI00336BB2AE